MPPSYQQFLQIGKILNMHGIQGEVKAEHWCDSPSVLSSLHTLFLTSNGTQPLTLQRVRTAGRFLLLTFSEINSIERAIPLKNKILYANRDDIKKGASDIFLCDLIGLDVYHADSGVLLGTLTDILDNPAHPLYEIRDTGEKTVLVPAVSPFVVSVSVEHGIRLRPIKGMFDEISSPKATVEQEKVRTPISTQNKPKDDNE